MSQKLEAARRKNPLVKAKNLVAARQEALSGTEQIQRAQVRFRSAIGVRAAR